MTSSKYHIQTSNSNMKDIRKRITASSFKAQLMTKLSSIMFLLLKKYARNEEWRAATRMRNVGDIFFDTCSDKK